MKVLYTLLFFCLLLFSCRDAKVPPVAMDDAHAAFRQKSFRLQLEELEQKGAIQQLEIKNIRLQRVSTGAIQSVATYSYHYCPAIDLFHLTHEDIAAGKTYAVGLRRGGVLGPILDVEVSLTEMEGASEPLVEINGIAYHVRLETIQEGENATLLKYIFTPSADVPGVAEEYSRLISALNDAENGDVERPGLPIRDMRVLSLESITLTFLLDKAPTPGATTIGLCQEVTPSKGLVEESEGKYYYKSEGGAEIRIYREKRDNLTITIGFKSYPNFTFQMWGANEDPDKLSQASHENLNGKHLKDRFGPNRTILFPDGTKLTLEANGEWYFGEVVRITIYDGDIVHHFNMDCFKLEFSGRSALLAQRLDEQQADGETSSFEIKGDELFFFHFYDEKTPCRKVENKVNHGSLDSKYPSQVNDLVDDPRLGHT
jgi:hypothetical protein